MSLGKPQLQAKFEVASFSFAKILKGKPQILKSSLSPGPRPFSSRWDFIIGLLPSVVAEILKGNPQIWAGPLAQGHAHFSSGCDFVMGLGKAHLPANLEIASFSRCRNIKEKPQNFRELLLPTAMPTFFCV